MSSLVRSGRSRSRSIAEEEGETYATVTTRVTKRQIEAQLAKEAREKKVAREAKLKAMREEQEKR